jgi:hypothetical protein
MELLIRFFCLAFLTCICKNLWVKVAQTARLSIIHLNPGPCRLNFYTSGYA